MGKQVHDHDGNARALLPLDVSGIPSLPQQLPVDAQLWPPQHSALDDTRPPETLDLWGRLGFNQYTLTLIIVLGATLWQIAFTIMLAAQRVLNVQHYTYWSLIMFTALCVALTIALLVRRGVLTFVLLWMLPIVLGTTTIVSFGIVVVISLDAAAYIDGSVCAPGGTTTIERLHTGDWLLHTLPHFVIDRALEAGLLAEVRDVYRGRMSQWSRAQSALFGVGFALAPLVPLVVYDLVFDARQVYSIALSRPVIWLLACVFIVVVQLYYLLAFTLDKRHKQRLVPSAALWGNNLSAIQRRVWFAPTASNGGSV